MAAPTGAYVLRNCVITVEATDFANQVTTAKLVPESATQTIKTLVPDGIVVDQDSTQWTFELSGIQDWTDATGLCSVLHAAAGTQIDVVLTPRAGVGKKATFVAVAQSPDFGGEQGAWTTFSLTLGVVGAPVFAAVV